MVGLAVDVFGGAGVWVRMRQAIKADATNCVDKGVIAAGSFDKVLLDAPCSALGLRPSLRVGGGSAWSAAKSRMVDRKALVQHALYQRLMLRQAVKALRPGGLLLFSTCTLNPDENEGNTAWALEHLGLELVDLRLRAQELAVGAVAVAGIEGGGRMVGREGSVGLRKHDCERVLRFNPGDPCELVPLPEALATGIAEAQSSGARALGVDLCPGFYMACFRKAL